MAERDEGGPAFPTERTEWDGGQRTQWVQSGMTLRDWFAGQAVAGWGEGHHGNSHYLDPSHQGGSSTRFPDTRDVAADYAVRMARFAYNVADAMIAARGRTP